MRHLLRNKKFGFSMLFAFVTSILLIIALSQKAYCDEPQILHKVTASVSENSPKFCGQLQIKDNNNIVVDSLNVPNKTKVIQKDYWTLQLQNPDDDSAIGTIHANVNYEKEEIFEFCEFQGFAPTIEKDTNFVGCYDYRYLTFALDKSKLYWPSSLRIMLSNDEHNYSFDVRKIYFNNDEQVSGCGSWAEIPFCKDKDEELSAISYSQICQIRRHYDRYGCDLRMSIFTHNNTGVKTGIKVCGNIMSLYYGANTRRDDPQCRKFPNFNPHLLQGLFDPTQHGGNKNSIVSTGDYLLPATSLPEFAYREMFANNESLENSPIMPNITEGNIYLGCFEMLNGCKSIQRIKVKFSDGKKWSSFYSGSRLNTLQFSGMEVHLPYDNDKSSWDLPKNWKVIYDL